MKKGKQQNEKKTLDKTSKENIESHLNIPYLESTYTCQTILLRASYQSKQRKQNQKGH
jgi:hypothetical protein